MLRDGKAVKDGDVVRLEDGRLAQLMFCVTGTWFAREIRDGERGPGPWRLEQGIAEVVTRARTTKTAGKSEEYDPLRGDTSVCCGAERLCIGCPRREEAA